MQQITSEMINSIRDLFIVRDDCYPMQINGVNEYKVIKQKFSDEIIKKHLQGSITVGSFQIDPQTNKVKWICFDFDGDLQIEFEKAKILYNRLKEKSYNPLLEFSGRRGYHVWLFIESIDVSIAKKFANEIATDIDVSEIFPKQDKIEKTGFGGQVKLPLGIHRVSYKRSHFYDINYDSIPQESISSFLPRLINKKKDIINIKNIKNFISD